MKYLLIRGMTAGSVGLHESEAMSVVEPVAIFIVFVRLHVSSGHWLVLQLKLSGIQEEMF